MEIEKKELTEDLSLYNPSMEWKEFYDTFGVDYNEWLPDAEALSAESQAIYPWLDFKDNVNGFIVPKMSPFNIYFINKNLKQFGLRSRDIFRANSEHFRSDEFTNVHEGLHVLFAGCSITFGDGMFEEYIWPKIVYDQISKDKQTSGYFNVAFPGADHTDILLQIFRYIQKYGNPDIIFINFPDIERQINHGMTLEMAANVVSGLYQMLETYCDANQIDLISFTWNDTDNLDPQKAFIEAWAFRDKPGLDPRRYFGDTYHRFSIKDRHLYIMDYEQANKSHKYSEFMIRGLDIVHPGIAEHAFYGKLAYEYLEKYGKYFKTK